MQVYGLGVHCGPALQTANTQTQHKTTDIYRLHVMLNLQIKSSEHLRATNAYIFKASSCLYIYIYMGHMKLRTLCLSQVSSLSLLSSSGGISTGAWRSVRWIPNVSSLVQSKPAPKLSNRPQYHWSPFGLTLVGLPHLQRHHCNIMFSQTAIALQFAGLKAYPLSYLRGQVKSFNFIPNMNLASTFPHANNTMI